MSNYFNKPGDKKRRLMEVREEGLRRCLLRQADADQCVKAAEALRQAALAYYQAISLLDGHKPNAWRERSVESILQEYGKQRGQSGQ